MKFEEFLNQVQVCFDISHLPIVNRLPIGTIEDISTLMKVCIRQAEHLIRYNGYSKNATIIDTLSKMKVFQEVCDLISSENTPSDVKHALSIETDWEKIKQICTVQMDKLATKQIILNQFENIESSNTMKNYLEVTGRGVKVGHSIFDEKDSSMVEILELFDCGKFIKRDIDKLHDLLVDEQKTFDRVTARKFFKRYETYKKILSKEDDYSIILLNAPILESNSEKYVEFNGKDVSLSKTRYSNVYKGVYKEFGYEFTIFLDCSKEATI